MRAGVIPALTRSGEGWDALIIRPGREPMAAVADPFSQPSVTLLPGLRGLDPQACAAARAGLIVRLGAEPGYLGTALREWSARERRRLLLFVDQLEELYMQGCDAGKRAAFLRARPASPTTRRRRSGSSSRCARISSSARSRISIS